MFLQQTWALAKKDLTIILRRRWLSTFIRALAFPIVFTVIIAYIKIWTQNPGSYGIGSPSPIHSLSDALAASSSTRPRVVIVDNGFKDGDIASVVANISSIINASGKELVSTTSSGDLTHLCQSTTGGVSSCFAAVEFKSSPTNPGYDGSRNWNYTIYNDASTGLIDVTSQDNGPQIYALPLQRAIDTVIASTKGRTLPNIAQFPYTRQTDEQRKISENQDFQGIVVYGLAVAFFVGLSSSIYHLVGHVVGQRDSKMTQLIDAMMPKKSPWEAIIARMLATHLVFDLIYLPSWIVMGAALSVVVFPQTNPGWYILLYVLTGIALNSYSVLASSLFRKVQLSANCAIIVAFVLAIAAQFGIGTIGKPTDGVFLNGAVYALSILFPPSAYCFFVMQTAGFEYDNQALQIDTPSEYFDHWKVSAGSVLACLLFSIILYPIVAVVIEKYLWGTDSKQRIVMAGDSMGGVAVRIRNFSKSFRSIVDKKQTVQAVDDLTLDVHSGSITVLLGANGSGKSTTLNTIAGLETITSGSIEIDGTGGLGLCPQANIIYPMMSVREHVDFFESLKNTSTRSRAERKAEVDRIIDGCDLANKRDAIAKTLSGGQKRKLQLAMMLAGGSRVCCIDEASSGIDPISRRKIWDILRAERGQRSLLFTTHFLDEAEGLSDHVAILSKGCLKAQGSVAALKNALGGGYRIVLQDSAREADIILPGNVKAEKDYNRTVYNMPNATVLAEVVAKLDQRNIHSYRVEGPTVEKVFLALSDEVQGDSDLARELRMADGEGLSVDDSATLVGDSLAPASKPTATRGRPLNLTSGRSLGPVEQTLVILTKRFVVLKHNFMPYVAAIFVSLVVAGCCTLLLPNNPRLPGYYGVPCQDPNGQQTGPYANGATKNSFAYGFVYGPPNGANGINASTFMAAEPDRLAAGSYYAASSYYNGSRYNVSMAKTVSSLPDFNNYISNHMSSLYEGGLYNGTSATYIAWQEAEYAAQLQGIVNGIAMNETISFSSGYFLPAFTPSGNAESLFVVITTLGFSIYPGFMALYVTAERLKNVRQMHFSNGILSSSLWAGHALFDLMFVILISALTAGIWASQWKGWFGLGYMFIVLFLYGITSVTFAYIVSLFARSQLAAYACAAVIQVVIAMLYFISYVLTTSSAPPDMVNNWFSYIYYTIALICPAVSLERALFIAVNSYSLACHGTSYASYPGEIGIYGAPILYLVVQFVVCSMFLMYWEGGRSLEVFGIRSARKQKQIVDLEKLAAIRTQNPDATEADERLSLENTGLRVENISKSFGKNLAVDHATFGILPSEKFALLGPNGAGKSTMISLIRRDLKPDHDRDGNAIHIGGDDLHSAPMAARAHLGVCPQFDSIDSMTLIEHLRFYARARGVPDREANINELINRLGLTDHKNKLAKKLSGGTKRKLSLAIALVANPSVLLLDEPSSGMDPAAKRALWSTLSAIAEGRVLLMTTHSMEEADALCDRAGIISSRMLALGTMEDLRHRHGNAAFIHLVHKDAPYTTTEQMADMNAWVERTFPNAIIEQRNFGGQMRFSVPQAKLHNPELETGKLFRLIEHVKEEIGVVDYSIGPATLDQVFLNVVEKHNVQEENSKLEVKTGLGLRKRFMKK